MPMARPFLAFCLLFRHPSRATMLRDDRIATKGSTGDSVDALPTDQADDRTSLPGRAPVSSPFSKIGVPEQTVMS